MQPKPIHLTDAYKQYSHDQDKIISPSETVARFKHKLADSGLKILDDIVRIDNGRLDIPVYFSVCGSEAQAVIGNNKQMGKGATPEQSQASAVMELAERFSLFSFRRDESNFIEMPLNDIKEPTIGFDNIAKSVGDQSDDLPAVKELFSTLPLKWTWAYNLTRNESVMIPFNWFWTINEFNGSSAGNGIEEAICQGICEVVERHVSARICTDRIKVPLIDMDSVKDPVALELIGKYQKEGIHVRLSDFTLDMGIPSIGAIAWDPNTLSDKSEIVWTAGTMPDPYKALCRALTEVAQLAGDFNSGSNYEASGLPKFRNLAEADYVINPGQTVGITGLPDLGNNNIKTEIEGCLSAFADRHMDVFTMDVRHPVLDIPAFYTIIPGTRFRERAAQPSVGMIYAKIVSDNFPAPLALNRLDAFNRVLPDRYYTHFYVGQILMNHGDLQSALNCFEKAADLGPGSEDLAAIQTFVGICYKEMDRYGEALAALAQADGIDPERTDTLNLMGFCHFKQKAYGEAIDCFKRVITLNPNSAIDYANIGVNYRALGDNEKAIEYYQRALTIDSSIDFAREHLAQLGVK